MMVNYLGAEQIIAINTRLMMEHQQVSFVRNANGLDSLVHLPSQELFGKTVYPTLASKLGIVFIKLINLHCFEDGNKRTAVVALLIMARLNGYKLSYSKPELADLALLIAQTEDQKLQYQQVYENIDKHLIRV
ncbi:type II toxin-antitoxin system death-on-curing family toxin [Lactiplantibacillus plantarum]|uniref:type II toxin-antitoxin system death-on-curing family toxin n=1 Tax=Lactiplantibacillus plantarum TaxID=1590 RepID=UPI0020010A13|nr:type II toxin-antitoxin system death-on-curing family toxin [Lactiplantibacillus plantarum]